MKRVIRVISLSLVGLVLVSCSGEKPSAEEKKPTASQGGAASHTAGQQNVFRTISPQNAQQMIGDKKDLLVVDVRNPQELREGFIAGSTLIPFWEIAKGRKSLPSDRPLLLVCAVGGRSYAVGQFLSRKGYPEVYNLQGGISAWKRAGLPLQYK